MNGPSASMPGVVMTPPWRGVTAALVTVSRGGVLLVALVSSFASGPLPTGTLLHAVSLVCFAPALAAWIIRRVHTATITTGGDVLVMRARPGRVDVPLASIAAVDPWPIPLPAPGFSLRLTSAERLPEGLMPDDPAAFLAALAAAGVPDEIIGAARRHPMTIFGHAKRAARRRIDHPLVKFALFSLVPTLPLFRLRQFLVYGGTFGEYYQYGLEVYLLGFGMFWLLYAVYLLLYAAVLRALTEAAALSAAYVAPRRAAGVRHVAEIANRMLYFLGVPAVLALRFYPW